MIMNLTTVARMMPRTAVMPAACASEKTYEAQTRSCIISAKGFGDMHPVAPTIRRGDRAKPPHRAEGSGA